MKDVKCISDGLIEIRPSVVQLTETYCKSYSSYADLEKSETELAAKELEFLRTEGEERKNVRRLSIQPVVDVLDQLEKTIGESGFSDFRVLDAGGERVLVQPKQLAKIASNDYSFLRSLFNDLINMVAETVFHTVQHVYSDKVSAAEEPYLELSKLLIDRPSAQQLPDDEQQYAGAFAVCAGFATPIRHHFAYLRAAIELFPIQYGRAIAPDELMSINENTFPVGQALQQLTMRQLLALEKSIFNRVEPDLDRQFIHCPNIQFADLTHLWIGEEEPKNYSVQFSEQLFEIAGQDYKIAEIAAGCPANGILNQKFHRLLTALTERFVVPAIK